MILMRGTELGLADLTKESRRKHTITVRRRNGLRANIKRMIVSTILLPDMSVDRLNEMDRCTQKLQHGNDRG